jgi:hypothetical protein
MYIQPRVSHTHLRTLLTRLIAPGNAFLGHGQRRWSEGCIAELERKIGQSTLDIDLRTWRDTLQQARIRFTNQGQFAVNSVRWSSLLQRTANRLLTGCLTRGDKRSAPCHIERQIVLDPLTYPPIISS